MQYKRYKIQVEIEIEAGEDESPLVIAQNYAEMAIKYKSISAESSSVISVVESQQSYSIVLKQKVAC